jgi:hypothetical protein
MEKTYTQPGNRPGMLRIGLHREGFFYILEATAFGLRRLSIPDEEKRLERTQQGAERSISVHVRVC